MDMDRSCIELKILIGDFFLITSLEYSSRKNILLAQALKDFNVWEIKNGYLKIYPDEAEQGKFYRHEDKFAAYLLKEGYCKEVDCKELHLMDYDSIEDITLKGKFYDRD